MSGDDWNTPPEIFEPAMRLMPRAGDPFSNASTLWRPHWRLREWDDGFTAAWGKGRARGRRGEPVQALVNGPWSKQRRVVTRCLEEAERDTEIVLVQPSSVNSRYWADIRDAPAVIEPSRRIQFWRDGKPSRGNRTDVVIVYWGVRAWLFRRLFRGLERV